MLPRLHLLLPMAAAVLALVPAAAASAKTATFTGTFEAVRTVKWDQPRGVSQITCRGEHYYQGHGSETWTVRTRKPFKVVVTGSAKKHGWMVGDQSIFTDPLQTGQESGGPRTREFVYEQGTTGGWCGGGEPDTPRASDCGTRLPTYLVDIAAWGRNVDWTMKQAPWTRNERIDFYNCWLMTPDGLPVGSFPRLPAKVNGALLFNKKRKTIEIGSSKTYGPTVQPVENLGVARTATATVRWTLTLTRKK